MKEEDDDKGKGARKLIKAVEMARKKIGGTVDKATGAEFRRQFEEFTEASTNVVLGLHRGQSELANRLEQLEGTSDKSFERQFKTKGTIWTLGASIAALVLSSLALLIALT